MMPFPVFLLKPPPLPPNPTPELQRDYDAAMKNYRETKMCQDNQDAWTMAVILVFAWMVLIGGGIGALAVAYFTCGPFGPVGLLALGGAFWLAVVEVHKRLV